jgi:hypothetical protein
MSIDFFCIWLTCFGLLKIRQSSSIERKIRTRYKIRYTSWTSNGFRLTHQVLPLRLRPSQGWGVNNNTPAKLTQAKGIYPRNFASALAVGHKTDGDHVLRVIP